MATTPLMYCDWLTALGEIQNAAAGVRAMNAAERVVMKHKFAKLAGSMKNPDLRESVLAMAQ